MSNELSAHERLQRYDDARRLLLWSVGLEKHKEAEQQIKDAMSEMRITALLAISSRASPEDHAEGRRAMDALMGFMIGTQSAALSVAPHWPRIAVRSVREDMAESVAEWWLGPKAASELRDEVGKLERDRIMKKQVRKQRRLAGRAGSGGCVSAAL